MTFWRDPASLQELGARVKAVGTAKSDLVATQETLKAGNSWKGIVIGLDSMNDDRTSQSKISCCCAFHKLTSTARMTRPI